MLKRWGAGLLLLVIAAPMATRSANAPAFFPADAERGRTLAGLCMACHGPPNVALGAPAVHPPKLVGQRPDAIYLMLLAYKRGTRSNPIMSAVAASLSLQDMRDVGAYLAAAGPDRPPEVTITSDWAHEKVHRDCTACHGESGMGELWGTPVITGQHRDYLTAALNAYRDGTRTDPTMAPIAARLTPEEVERLAEYFSAQEHLRLSR